MLRSWRLRRWALSAGAILLVCGVSLGLEVRDKSQSDVTLIGGKENKWVCFIAAGATAHACFTLNAPICAFGIMWLEQNC